MTLTRFKLMQLVKSFDFIRFSETKNYFQNVQQQHNIATQHDTQFNVVKVNRVKSEIVQVFRRFHKKS